MSIYWIFDPEWERMRETAKCRHSYGDVTHTYIHAIVDENTCRSKWIVSQHSSVCYIPYTRMDTDRYYALCWFVYVFVFCCCHCDENRLCLVFTETCTYMFPWLSSSTHFLYYSIEFSLWCCYCWFFDAFLFVICFFSSLFKYVTYFFFGFILLSNSRETKFCAQWCYLVVWSRVQFVYEWQINGFYTWELIPKRETVNRLHVRSCCRWVRIIHKMSQWIHKRHRTDKVNWDFIHVFRLNFAHTTTGSFCFFDVWNGERGIDWCHDWLLT